MFVLYRMSAEQSQPADPRDPAQDDASSDAHRARAALIERLFREHNEALIRFLVPRVRSHQEAREVAQEAYVRMLSLDEPGAVNYMRAFLFKTAANIAIDRKRRDDAHARATRSPPFAEFIDVRTPERRVAGEQAIQRLQRVVAALPTKCRQAFVLNEFYGMDFASIAAEMKISERMVRKYVVRALLLCRAALDRGNGE